jgi:mRNA-degrading endonuclease RelE of RelBE toxin-antitoxin system
VAKRQVRLAPDAVRQFKALNAAERSRLKAAMQASLGDDDTSVQNQNRFALRRPSKEYEFELRAGNLRVFYRIVGNQVLVDAIGRKIGSQLFIGNRRVIL